MSKPPAGRRRRLLEVLGRTPEDVTPAARRTLLAVGLALYFEEYDSAMLISALKQIAESLGMASDDLGLFTALVRLGALPAFFIVALADRWGRKPVFIAATVLVGLLTFATAFVQSPMQFMLLQGLARTFMVTSTAVAFVIVTEELPAQHRGWGVGALAALGSMGHGLSALLYSQVERLPFGWRALYVVGLVPVLCLPWLLRWVPETERYLTLRAQRAAQGSMTVGRAIAAGLGPIRELFTLYPKRAASLAACGVLIAAGALPSFQFSGYYTQARLGWTPANYSTMVIVAGGLGIIGNVVAGRLGDRFGRKAVGIVLLGVFPLASYAFFNGGSVVVVAAWVPLVFCLMGSRVILRALSAELFPTTQRSAASGLFTVTEMVGAIVGLLGVHFYGTPSLDAIARVMPAISLLTVGSALLMLTFPETKNRELEDFGHGH